MTKRPCLCPTYLRGAGNRAVRGRAPPRRHTKHLTTSNRAGGWAHKTFDSPGLARGGTVTPMDWSRWASPGHGLRWLAHMAPATSSGAGALLSRGVASAGEAGGWGCRTMYSTGISRSKGNGAAWNEAMLAPPTDAASASHVSGACGWSRSGPKGLCAGMRKGRARRTAAETSGRRRFRPAATGGSRPPRD